MAKMAVILRGLATSFEADAYGLEFAALLWELLVNKFRIYDICQVRQNNNLPVTRLDEKLPLL